MPANLRPEFEQAATSGDVLALESPLNAGADLEIRGTGAPGFWNKTAYDLATERGMNALCAEITQAKESRA